VLDIPLLLLSDGWQPANARAADIAHNTQKYFSFIYSLSSITHSTGLVANP
jgi:hypothetical protein